MKQKLILIIMLALSLIVMSACEEEDTQQNTQANFAGGTKGITMKYSDHAPPDEVIGGGEDPFYVTLELTNEGEHEVSKEDIKIQLSGFSATRFGVTNQDLSKNPDEDLEPTMKTSDGSIIPGPTTYMDFEGFNYEDNPVTPYDYTFKAEVCYNYGTLAVSDICIKQNFDSDVAGDVCKVSEKKSIANTGAPIQVTEIRQTPEGRDRTRIIFTVENRENGEIFKTESGCDRTIHQNKDKVFVELSGIIETQGDLVDCPALREGGSASGYLDLSEGRAEVSCRVQLEDKSQRTQPIQIRLRYDYSEHIQTTVTVKPE